MNPFDINLIGGSMGKPKKTTAPRRASRKKPTAREARVERISRLARRALKGLDVPPP